ncbi:TonB-dependent siderophore receptor [Photobacterium rosenbergii]|uniref:TonB-dependent siderophore receptor n=1 Tax=Photobacterium rosenbergii TaxID=294936 RepID=A0ABU3ZGR6_9GAMM|nr:TonB-dependent siderophore receptor [Photobacterium rosenbergii]MDV5169281.1 TonB-dependent siderophore receptor [Photobacterium rosenbergii]
MNKPKAAATAVRYALLFGALPVATLAPLVAHADEPATQMETITVTAQALKVDVPAEETPRAVSIVSEEELRQRSPQKLDEALRYTSGVTAQPFGNDNDTDWFRVRGFEAATYLDGNRLFRDGYYTWLLEPYGLERVEVVKGPAAILYGEAPPGGVVNAVQKKPTFTPQGEVKVEVGNNNHQAVAFDVSDEANEDGTMRYRLVGTMKSTDGELDGTNNERFYIAPSLEIDINDRTMLTLLGTYLKDDGVPTNAFFPAAGTLIDSDFGKIDPSTNLGQPDYDNYEREQFSIGYRLEHDYNDVWQLTQNFSYGYNKLNLISSYAFFNNDPSVEELTQGLVYRDGKNQSVTFDNNAVGNWYSDESEHTLLVGVDFQYHNTDGVEQDNFAFGTINPWKPEYGNFTPIDPSLNIQRDISKTQASLYSQYQLKFQEQWIGIVGARYDWVKSENKGKGNTAFGPVDQKESRNDNQLSLNAGVMYLADNGLSPYASYAQSFEVLSTIDPSTGKLYKPLEGEQFEVGVKYTPEFIDGYVNVALFDITQKNALVTNPDTFIATQTGEVSSQGVEVEAVSQLTDDLKLSANYTYTDAQTDESGGRGTQQAGLIPQHAATAWIDYNTGSLGLEGLNIGTGIRYIGESKDNPASSDLTIPSVTLWDAAVTYDISKKWQAQLNVNNILDEEYVSGCDYWCYYGQSRSIMLNANYRW